MLNFVSLFLLHFPKPYLISTLPYLKDERALYRSLQSSKSSVSPCNKCSISHYTSLLPFSSLTDRLTEWLTDTPTVITSRRLSL